MTSKAELTIKLFKTFDYNILYFSFTAEFFRSDTKLLCYRAASPLAGNF